MTCFRTEYPSPVGLLTPASDGESLTGLWMAGQKHFGGPERKNGLLEPEGIDIGRLTWKNQARRKFPPGFCMIADGGNCRRMLPGIVLGLDKSQDLWQYVV